MLTVLRERCGLTQAELGRAVGCSQPAVSRWEGGRPPSAQSLAALQRVLELSPEEAAGLLASYGGTAPSPPR